MKETEAKEMHLTAEQITKMILATARVIGDAKLDKVPMKLVASDSYGPHKHRTWAFYYEGGVAMGCVERHWSGVKMIYSIYGGAPRTYFFSETLEPTTNKALRDKA